MVHSSLGISCNGLPETMYDLSNRGLTHDHIPGTAVQQAQHQQT